MSEVFKVIFGQVWKFLRHMKSWCILLYLTNWLKAIIKESTFISNDWELLKQKHTCIQAIQKKCCVSANIVKKNRVGRWEIFFFNFITSSSEYIANSNTIKRIFIELNKGFIFCIHRASVHMQKCPCLWTGWKYKGVFYIFLEQIRFF
jgi:hypothetical protein